MSIDVLGVEFDNLTLAEAVNRGMELISKKRGNYVVTPNPEIVWMARKDKRFHSAVAGASMTLPDGIGVLYASKILGRSLKGRVTGVDFATAMMEKLSECSGRVFLFGGKPGIADAAAIKLKEKFPGLVICGTENGYFTDSGPVIEKINAAKPDFMPVCLGAPKQELWMQDNAAKLDVGLMAGLGGVLDVFSGTVKRAPDVWCRMGMEWLYRLIKQPSRIGRMIKLPLFLFEAVGVRIRGQ